MKYRILLCLTLAFASVATAAPREASNAWASYLDYAYIYSSASPREIQDRLGDYAREAGITLDEYMAERIARSAVASEADKRRLAIGHLLQYIASGNAAQLEDSWLAIRELEDRLERHENRYWYHYIDTHRALDTGNSLAFTARSLRLWSEVIVDLEASYDTYQTLSLNDSRGAGFVSALPYLYENVARLILIRSQRMGLRSGLDPLAAIVRFLGDGRLGAYPDIIDPKASSRDYLDAIAARLNGPESDGGSLSFTLALFEANRYHDLARARLASDGFSGGTLDAVRITVGAYSNALARATTLQGQATVYTRVLRQLGELHAAKQRLGVDPEVEIPFSIARAIKIYAALDRDLDSDWEKHGYQETGRESYVQAMHSLWEEIQEASFNVAAYYHDRGIRQGLAGKESLADAVSTYSRYLTFFNRYAEDGSGEGIPDSAFFAAYDAARGIGDAILQSNGGDPSSKQLQTATRQYLAALEIFPFEPRLWSSTAVALERQGRESDYLSETQAVAEAVTNSRTLNNWIQARKTNAERFDALRRALGDDLALMYLGFSTEGEVGELENGLVSLRERRDLLEGDLAQLRDRLDSLGRSRSDQLADPSTHDLPGVAASGPAARQAGGSEIARISTRIDELDSARERLDETIAARVRALPLFKAAIGGEDLARDLSAQRRHPVHSLVRRMHTEGNLDKEESR